MMHQEGPGATRGSTVRGGLDVGWWERQGGTHSERALAEETLASDQDSTILVYAYQWPARLRTVRVHSSTLTLCTRDTTPKYP